MQTTLLPAFSVGLWPPTSAIQESKYISAVVRGICAYRKYYSLKVRTDLPKNGHNFFRYSVEPNTYNLPYVIRIFFSWYFGKCNLPLTPSHVHPLRWSLFGWLVRLS